MYVRYFNTILTYPHPSTEEPLRREVEANIKENLLANAQGRVRGGPFNKEANFGEGNTQFKVQNPHICHR